MGADTEENVNIGFHPLELEERPLFQIGPGGLEGNKVKGGSPGEAEQGRHENTEKGGWIGRRAEGSG